MVRVSVYDDNKARRESLEAFLQLSPGLFFAGGFENCTHILTNIQSAEPDLILMDIEMPETDGISGVLQVKKNYPHIKIIMQTAFDDDDKVFAAIQAGAEGYILKNASIVQLSQSIDEVMNGGASMSPSIALKVMRYFSTQAQPNNYHLTLKETEVLKHLSKGLSYKMIADQMGISYFTVNNHVKKIYEKLQVHSLGEAVAMAHKNKLV
ncbi:response regulator transcription factor [Limnovirga soli]|uniref:Response regulator n=1 Tax=Limnovirga soli TaxID=2656915 RepID=A0A8J8FGA2_9BACT|nr:response regulator transcription factor [Limnovirga soli]NNV57510.1 response regulator [Limnovirga soli]